MKSLKAGLGALLCSTALVTPVYAQDAEGAEDDADDNTIIVTATRRAENLQEIPLAVTAVSTEQLDRQGIADIRSLSAVSASFNLNSSDTETGGTTLRIRGVGTTGNNIGLESAVGVFLDGVYLSRPGAALGDLVDVERVEILRGPQGTLFGRNTSAGALNITTKKPNLSEIEGFANASYGNFDFFNVQGGISVPVVQDELGIRVTGAYRRRDGTIDNLVGDINSRNRYNLRGQVYWEPSDSVNIRLIADFSSADERCCEAVQLAESILFAGPGAGSLLLAGLPADGGAPNIGISSQENRQGNSSSQFTDSFDNLGFSAELNWDIGDAATLTYIGSWREFEAFSTRSTDFVDLQIFSVGVGDSIDPAIATPSGGPITTWTQELRLQGEALDDRLNWLVGFYYSNEKIRTDSGILGLGPDYEAFFNAFLTSATAGGVTNVDLLGVGPVDFNGAFADNRFSQDAESWSIFTHNSFDITDTITLTAGIRYTEDSKQGSFTQAAAQSDACETLLPVFGGGALSPFNGLNCFAFATTADLPQATDVVGLPLTFGNGAQGGDFDEFNDEEFIYTGKIAWQPTPDINTYASFTHGYKSGGFNLDASASASTGTFDLVTGAAIGLEPRFLSETVNAFEIGLKATLLDGRATLNISAFHQDLTNFQVLEFTGVAFQTFNVPEALSTGVEVEFQGQLTDSLSISLAGTYTDARYPNDCDDGFETVTGPAAPLPQVSSLCSFDLTNAPEFVGNAGFVYTTDINSDGWSMTASANVRYETSRRTSTQAVEPTGAGAGMPLPLATERDNAKVNARLGLTTPNGNFTIEAWGNNIFDVQTRNVTFNTPLRGASGARARSAFLEDPATYGVTVRTKF